MKLYQSIEYLVNERVAWITLNRPHQQNALSDILIIELKDALISAQQDAMVKVILINARGSDFSKGTDPGYLKKIGKYNMDQNMADSSALAQLFLNIYRSPKVVIAQVEGDALDSGCGLITVCDFVFAVPAARFGFTEVKMGWAPALVMPFLLRKIGETRCKELLLSGEVISGQKAHAYNLINELVPQEEIHAFILEFTQKLCKNNSPASLQLTKKMIADIQDFPMENAIKFAAKMNAYSRATDDSKRGIEATLNQQDLLW